jgi:hypothetical protein
MYEIKKDIPVPTDTPAPNSKYPFGQMAPGDCFDTDFRPNEGEDAALRRMRSTTATWRIRHNSSLTFVVRALTENGRTFLRVWAREGRAPKKRAVPPAVQQDDKADLF